VIATDILRTRGDATKRFCGYGGPVYVLNPDRSIAEMIEERLKTPHVIWVKEKWNILSAAMMDRILGGGRSEPLRDACSRLDDQTGGTVAFAERSASQHRLLRRWTQTVTR
jgi:hypothetical protein